MGDANHPRPRESQALRLQNNTKKLTGEEDSFIYSLDLETKEKHKTSSSSTYSFIQQIPLSTYCVAFSGPSAGNMINKECIAIILQDHTA